MTQQAESGKNKGEDVPQDTSGIGIPVDDYSPLRCATFGLLQRFILKVLCIIPIYPIVIGSYHVQRCPVEPFIPKYVIVTGCFGFFPAILYVMYRIKVNDNSGKAVSFLTFFLETRPREHKVDPLYVLVFFLLAWTVAGAICIYRVCMPDTDSESIKFCDTMVYYAAIILNGLTPVVVLLTIFLGSYCRKSQ